MTHLSERHIFVDADYRQRLWLCVNWCVDSFVRYNGVVVVRQNGGAFTPYVLFADEQGSVLTVADKDGNRVFEASYDAWGRQTVSTNTIGFTRGYTGHEMLAEFGIINMGGRLYDPVLGRFFSPDNYVQAPTDSQNFNRYSYCLNNPLKYTDPTGESISIGAIIFSLYNIGSSMMNASFADKNIWKAGAISALASAASFGIGQAFKAVSGFGHELLRAGAHGLSAGVFTVLGGGNFGSGFVSGATASGIGSFAEGIKNISPGLKLLTSAVAGGMSSWASGGDFIMGAVNGLRITALNHLEHSQDDDDDSEFHNYVPKGAQHKKLPEVQCVADNSKNSIAKMLFVSSITNLWFDRWGTAMANYGYNSTLGDNWTLYFHGKGERGFGGNGKVRTVKLSAIGNTITRFTGPAGKVLSGANIANSIRVDISQDQPTYGYNTVKSIAETVGGWKGAIYGSVYGAKLGFSIGIYFGGVGAVSGTIIGSAICGFAGSIGCEWFCGETIDLIYGK